MTRNQETDTDEDWVVAAMADDSAVAELLTLFRRAPPPPPRQKDSLSPPPLEWTVRQPRSKATPRASPTTPLSWSGGVSVSGGSGGGGSEETNGLPKLGDGARSKVIAAGEIHINKRSRKKKTLAQLKEEETLLVKERGDLKRQLETFRFTLENQRAMNESLKRLKIDLKYQDSSMKAIPNQMQLQNTSFVHPVYSISTEDIRNKECDALKRPPLTEEISSEKFVLPDLNAPCDEHFNIEIL